MTHEHQLETGTVMTMKAAPPLTVAGASLLGVPLDDWIKWGTLIYLVVMIGHQCWKWWREWKKAKQEDAK